MYTVSAIEKKLREYGDTFCRKKELMENILSNITIEQFITNHAEYIVDMLNGKILTCKICGKELRIVHRKIMDMHTNQKDICPECYKQSLQKKYPDIYINFPVPVKVKCVKCKEELYYTEKNFPENNISSQTVYFHWCKKCNAEMSKIIHHRRKARMQSVESDFTKTEWEECKQFFDNKCAYCGVQGKLTQDHVIPVAEKGGYTKKNIIPACQKCNSSKNKKNFIQWYMKKDFFEPLRLELILKWISSEYEVGL